MKILMTTTKGTYDVTQLIITVRWSGDLKQSARTLTLSILSSAADKSIPYIDLPLGTHVKMLESKTTLFDGFIFF